MRSDPGVVKHGPFHALSSLVGSILANLNIVAACFLAALFLSLLSWGVLIGGVLADREDGIQDSLTQAATMARAYSEQVARAINSHDLVLRQARYGWQLSQGSMTLDSPGPGDMFRNAPFSTLAIIDKAGAPVTATKPGAVPADASQAPYFRVHAGAAQDRLVISQVGDGAGQVQALQFSRAIRAADGRFDGVVLIQVAANELTLNFFMHRFAPRGLVGLVSNDGSLLIAAAETNGARLRAMPGLAPGGGSLLAVARWFSDQRSRYLGWHAAGRYPIVAFIALDEEMAMAQFDAARATAIRHGRIVTIAIFGVAAIVMGFLLRLTWRKRESQRTGETYRMATEGSSDGFFILAILLNGAGSVDDFEVIDCNEHGAALCHQRRETLIGRRFSGLYRDDTFSRVMEVLRIAVDSGAWDGELEFQPEGSTDSRWMQLKAVRSDSKLAITLRDISESKAHVAALEHRGNHDALTGLPNRHWLQWYLPQAIERARESHQTLALLFIDLDGFKAANDTMGHAAGDELLRHAAHRLKEAVRPHDNVIRLGGDEFVVILENNLRVEDAAIVATRVIQAFGPKFKLIGGTAVLGTSIGISSFPSDGEDAASLLQNADVAMYSVKTSGKGSFRFFDPEFYEALRRELDYEQELRRAIETDQFVIHYQPRMDLASSRTTSMEALVRWMHPQHGLIPPNEFIALAEENGAIVANSWRSGCSGKRGAWCRCRSTSRRASSTRPTSRASSRPSWRATASRRACSKSN